VELSYKWRTSLGNFKEDKKEPKNRGAEKHGGKNTSTRMQIDMKGERFEVRRGRKLGKRYSQEGLVRENCSAIT